MNQQFTRALTPDYAIRRKAEAYSLLEDICRQLELSSAHLEEARTSYEAVADWLSKSAHPALQMLSLYVHGSTALGTTVKPLRSDEFDVDLICRVLGITQATPPAELKKLIGDRLREHGVYASMLEEKKRCWRLNYARAFHLDISPTILNASCNNGGELVPDKSVKAWKPTNPSGYRKLFERRSEMQPRYNNLRALIGDTVAKADIAPFPAQQARKGILRRIVQLLKRHRDVFFSEIEADVAPISILITTLAMKSYEYCVATFTFDSELDVLVATIRLMPLFIDRELIDGRQIYVVANETTEGENFAERWNTEPARAKWFFEWHKTALSDFERLETAEGIDRLTDQLSVALGEGVVRKVMDARTNAISSARAASRILVAPAIGLTTTESADAVPVPKNTHFGDKKP